MGCARAEGGRAPSRAFAPEWSRESFRRRVGGHRSADGGPGCLGAEPGTVPAGRARWPQRSGRGSPRRDRCPRHWAGQAGDVSCLRRDRLPDRPGRDRSRPDPRTSRRCRALSSTALSKARAGGPRRGLPRCSAASDPRRRDLSWIPRSFDCGAPSDSQEGAPSRCEESDRLPYPPQRRPDSESRGPSLHACSPRRRASGIDRVGGPFDRRGRWPLGIPA